MIEEIRQNIEREIAIVKEISYYLERIPKSTAGEEKMINEAIGALSKKIKILNETIPHLLNNISVAQKLPAKPKLTGLEKVKIESERGSYSIVLKKEDKERYLSELNISESLLKKLRKEKKKPKAEDKGIFKTPRGYLKYANRFFLNYTIKLCNKGYFRKLAPELRKANIDVLFPTYIAMIFLTTIIAFAIGFFLMIIFTFVDLSFAAPFIGFYSEGFILRFIALLWIPFVLPGLTFFALYFYPSTETSSIGKKIDRELPFAVVHMSAISGSGIEPTKIFSIIGLSKEYPNLGKEIRKILNQINIYGYDLVSALNNVSRITPSMKAAELFTGLSTTISSGGDLTEFFEKRADSLLVDYRLEREKFTKIAETFMDIYISVVIATPMILLLLIIMISISGISMGFSPNEITLLIIIMIGLINVVFIGILHVKQPAY